MRRAPRSRFSFLQNLVAGEYNLLERLDRVRINMGRRSPRRSCCGNYGEPGC